MFEPSRSHGRRLCACGALLLAVGVTNVRGQSAPTTGPSDRIAWWRQARFGMFIHWGPVSLKGTEIGWSRGGPRRGYGSSGTEIPVEVYDNLYREFNPTAFKARSWVEVAQAAGMKYMVFTSRHHDGFSMFDTRASDYRITSPLSPFRRDVVKELADACHAAGLPFGVYYSQPHWQHPDAFTPDRHERYLDFLRMQVRELCANYGPLAVFWFDGLGKPARDYDGAGLVRIIRELQPNILINNRTGLPEDFDTPEQAIGRFQNDRPWESCITICQQWAWKPNDELKPLRECVQTLVRCAGADGNLLLNVGPMPTGEIEPRQVERLREIGAWLAKNGESIYGTRGGPLKPGPWGVSTHRDNHVYLHILDWSVEPIRIPDLGVPVSKSHVLGGNEIPLTKSEGAYILNVQPEQQQDIDTIVVLELAGPAAQVEPIAWASGSLAAGKPAQASNVFHGEAEFGADQAVDDDRATRWATDAGTHAAWLEIDLGRETTFDAVSIDEETAWGQRVEAFELQYQAGDRWRTCLTGTKLGLGFRAHFTRVSARYVRLNITEASEGPTISEFRLWRLNK
jgi:alpha-L-fucosidase